MSPTEPRALEAMNIASATPPTTAMATHGVFQRAVHPAERGRASYGRGPSRTGERVTWMRVVSSVAMVDSITATMSSLPPQPGQISSPSTPSTFASFSSICFEVRMTFTAMVNTSNSRKTMPTPISPASPVVRRLLRVSSLRLLVTSQPQ